jgi:hypothetical protein
VTTTEKTTAAQKQLAMGLFFRGDVEQLYAVIYYRATDERLRQPGSACNLQMCRFRCPEKKTNVR